MLRRCSSGPNMAEKISLNKNMHTKSENLQLHLQWHFYESNVAWILWLFPKYKLQYFLIFRNSCNTRVEYLLRT